MSNLEVLTEIQQDISEVKQLNQSSDIVGRMRLAERLSANAWYVSEMASDAYEASSQLEAEYENAVAFDEDTFTGAATKARAHAKSNHQTLNSRMVAAKATFKRLQSQLHQVNNVVEQLRSTISTLKEERKQSNYQV
jgi:cbb3-type cytochrome oxidase cytochrome c subunit